MVCRGMFNDGDPRHPTCSQTLSQRPGDLYNSPVNTLKSLDAPIFADEKKLEPQTLRGTTQDGMLSL